MDTTRDLQEQINGVVQACLALTAQVLATQSVLCRMDANARERIEKALPMTRLEDNIRPQGKMLVEATAADLEKAVLGMGKQLKEMSAR
jgi:hypothetical protein